MLAGSVISMRACALTFLSNVSQRSCRGETDLINVCQTVSSCNRLSYPLFIQAETSGTAGCLSFVSMGVHVSNNYVRVGGGACVS